MPSGPGKALSGTAHAGDFRERQNLFVDISRLDFIDRDGTCDIKPPRFDPPQRMKMRASSQLRTDVMCVGTDIKAFTANNREVDFG